MKSIRVGLVAIALCGLAAFGARIQSFAWEQEAAALSAGQERLDERIAALQSAMEAAADLETGRRGYPLTGDDASLENYRNGAGILATALRRLRELCADNSVLPQIDELAQIAAAQQRGLAETTRPRATGDAAAAIAKKGDDRRLMDDFRGKSQLLLVVFQREGAGLHAAVAEKLRAITTLGGVVAALILALAASAIGWLIASMRRLDEVQRQREREAMHDALTGLPNRRYLNDWLRMALAAGRRGNRPLVLLYFDLDGFKEVNDRCGIEAGDRVLQVIAGRLRGLMRASDFVARLGGDEFVAVLPDAPGEAALAILVARLSHDLAKAAIPELDDGAVSASIGVARFPGDGDDADALLGAADNAMSAVKQRRRAERAAMRPAIAAAAAD